jgi:hypothetical protein
MDVATGRIEAGDECPVDRPEKLRGENFDVCAPL